MSRDESGRIKGRYREGKRQARSGKGPELFGSRSNESRMVRSDRPGGPVSCVSCVVVLDCSISELWTEASHACSQSISLNPGPWPLGLWGCDESSLDRRRIGPLGYVLGRGKGRGEGDGMGCEQGKGKMRQKARQGSTGQHRAAQGWNVENVPGALPNWYWGAISSLALFGLVAVPKQDTP